MAIGVVPNIELATACGLMCEDGILVDETGQTSDPDIYAAGDVTRHPNAFTGTNIRLESWANAQNQAIIAARDLRPLRNMFANNSGPDIAGWETGDATLTPAAVR